MNKILRAMRSEHRRLWYKRSTGLWFLLFLLAGAFIVFITASASDYVNHDDSVTLLDSHFSAPTASSDDWQAEAEAVVNKSYERWNELADIAENGTYMQRALAQRERELAARESNIASYRLEHGISPQSGGMWRALQLAIWLLMPFVCVISAVAASDMFAGEYSRGTIYMNLARPVTRIKQYFAKMLTAWLYGSLLLIACFIGAALAGALLLGDDGGVYVGFINGEVYQTSWLRHSLAVLGCCLGTVIISITLCAALGTLTRSRAVAAVGASAVTGTSVWLGSAVAPSLGIVSGLSVFSCMDLTVPLMSAANYHGLSFADCCVSCGTHLIVFFIAGYYFMRRDIND